VFIRYLDADDLLTPDAIARRIAVVKEANADVAYSNWEKLMEVESGLSRSGLRAGSRT
jgi:hypothetical protein